ncbi:MAG: hypothetical protein AAGF89_01950 [Bacteroidota bacterium]
MRIIGRIPHPKLQITVFSNDGRFPVQFELDGQTQIYRFRHGEHLKGLADIEALVDDSFVTGVLATFRQMRKTQATVNRRLQSLSEVDDDLPEII